MKKMFQYIKSFLKEDFHFKYYFATAILLTIFIAINYLYFPLMEGKYITIERAIVNKYFIPRDPMCILAYALFYAIPYFAVVFLYVVIKKDDSFVRKREFWFKSLLAVFLMGLDANSHWYEDVATLMQSPPEYYWVRRTLSTFTNYIYIGLPLFLFWYFWDRKQPVELRKDSEFSQNQITEMEKTGFDSFYGLTFKGFDWQPYVLLMGIVILGVGIASFSLHFTSYYPTLKWKRLEGLHILPKEAAFVIYEIIYGVFYTWTEVMMRGFLVIAMGRVMGKNAVVPMAAMYAFRHFDKPLGETISSIFGGYLLGAIAYKSKNIVGGVFLHASIAVGMDIFALLHIEFGSMYVGIVMGIIGIIYGFFIWKQWDTLFSKQN
jgi:hypothetical protein